MFFYVRLSSRLHARLSIARAGGRPHKRWGEHASFDITSGTLEDPSNGTGRVHAVIHVYWTYRPSVRFLEFLVTAASLRGTGGSGCMYEAVRG